MKTQNTLQVGAFTGATLSALQNALNALGVFTTGNIYFVDAVNGNDTSGDGSAGNPFASIAAGYAMCSAGNNDVVVVVGNGSTTATQRITATLTWAKNATHLIGICAPTVFAQRARIAPTTTGAAFTPFVTISAAGCIFQNIEFYQGFATGTTAQINVSVTGQRNVFKNCSFSGMGDAASAADAGSRSLVVGSGGNGENLFLDCTIGLDTVTRGAANASLELAGGTPRNTFRGCIFVADASASSPFHVLGTGASCIDRVTLFQNCMFINAIKSGATTMTAAVSLTNASPGGLLAFDSCMFIGATKIGDTNALANSYIDMSAVSAAAGGLGVNPS